MIGPVTVAFPPLRPGFEDIFADTLSKFGIHRNLDPVDLQLICYQNRAHLFHRLLAYRKSRRRGDGAYYRRSEYVEACHFCGMSDTLSLHKSATC